MQLHAPSSVKQRVNRDKRLIRSMLQDSKDSLLQSLAVTAQTGLHSTTAQLAALHCLTAVQDSLPASAPALPAVDAPPGFAPMPVETALATPSFALKLWPYGTCPTQESCPSQWPMQDPEPLLQLLRVHKLIANNDKQQVPQQLLIEAVQSASLTHNCGLAERLITGNKAKTAPISLQLQLLELQFIQSQGKLDTTSASAQLWQMLSPALPKTPTPNSGSKVTPSASLHAQALLQLAKWCAPQAKAPAANSGLPSQVLRGLKETLISGDADFLPSDASPQALCLAAAVKAGRTSASAWLAYADCLHTLCRSALTSGLLGDPSISEHASPSPSPSEDTAPASQDSSAAVVDNNRTSVEMVKAYCMHLSLAAQSIGQAGVPEDHMPVLLKLIQLLSGDQAVPEVLEAVRSGTELVPVLTWRAVVPQLFALLAHGDAGVWGLAQVLLQRLQLVDPAAVLYPALVESKRISKGGL